MIATVNANQSNSVNAAPSSQGSSDKSVPKTINQLPCEATPITIGDVRTLLLCLKSPENSVLISVCETITSICTGQAALNTGPAGSPEQDLAGAKIQLLDARVVTYLMPLMQSSEAKVRHASVSCLAALTEGVDTHPDTANVQLLNILLTLLDVTQPPEVLVDACYSIANLVEDLANNSDFRKIGGLKALLKLLAGSDVDVQKNSAYALTVILKDYAAQAELRILKGIPILMEMTQSEYPEIKENALICLGRCAEDNVNRVEIRHHQGIRRILAIMENEETPAQVLSAASSTLSVLLEDNDSFTMFNELGGTKTLMKLVSHEDSNVVSKVVETIGVSSKNESVINFFKDLGAIQTIIQLLFVNDAEMLVHVLKTLGAIAKQESAHAEMIKCNVIDTVMKNIITNASLEVRQQGFSLCSSLATQSKIRTRIRQLDGIKILFQALQSDDSLCQKLAADTIALMADDVFNRAELLKIGGTETLLRLLNNSRDFGVQAAVAMALARCLHDADQRNLFAQHNGIEATIRLLKSKDVSVCRAATLLISSAALTEQLAIHACNMNAIPALIELMYNGSFNTSQFSKEALEKLLKHHLPAKYWLQNSLGFQNIVTDGFYDIGSFGRKEVLRDDRPVTLEFRFPTLEQLRRRSLDNRREILLVDGASDANFNALVKTTREVLFPKHELIEARIGALGELVSNHMGGRVDKAKLENFAYSVHVKELKGQFQSNVLFIGSVRKGYFYHRALLFKAIADKLGLGCSLVRGDYHRAWNVVSIQVGDEARSFIVDLMHQPGKLIPIEALEAKEYQRLV